MKNNYFLLLLFILLPFHSFSQAATDDAARLHQLLQDYDEDYLKLHPIWATLRGDNRYNDQLPVETEERRKKIKELYTTYLQLLSGVNQQKLSGQDLLNFQVFDFMLKDNLQGTDFDTYLLPISQITGLPSLFARLGSGKSVFSFNKVKDYDDFLKQMATYPLWTDTAIANMRKGIAIGVVQPKILMEKVLPQLEGIMVKDVEKNIFYGPIKNIPAGFTEEEKLRLTKAYTQAIAGQIVPSYQKLYDFIQSEYLPHCRTTYGFSEIPGGKEWYRFMVQYYTTTSLTPEEIFTTGMKEVARIRKEMEKVKAQVGFKGDLQAFFQYLDTDPRFYPFQTDEQVLQAFHDIHSRMLPRLKQYFNVVPKAPFEIRAVEKFLAATTSAHYMAPTEDGSRPGVFYVPIVDPAKYNNHKMENLFLHEAIPGHHYQIALQQEQEKLPNVRKFGRFIAYSEGWGLYVESLGKELGLFTDPYQYMGHLGGEMHRALRLVLDVGIHYKGWSREQAIEFSKQNEASSEQQIIAEVERYIANPGQALAYKIGELKIQELRSKAQKALGKKFDIRAFHDEILKEGALPLAVLETKITAWITNQQNLPVRQTSGK